MRAALFAPALLLAWPALLLCQNQDARPSPTQKTLTSDAPVSGKPPAVYWKRTMTGKPSPLPEPSPVAPQVVAADPPPEPPAAKARANRAQVLVEGDPPASATPEPEEPAPAKSAPPAAAPPPAPAPPPIPVARTPAPPRFSREQMVEGLAELKAGDSRADVIRRLGAPAYSIGMPDNGQYIEKCRFRAGGDLIATIELRDGVVTSIDKAAR